MESLSIIEPIYLQTALCLRKNRADPLATKKLVSEELELRTSADQKNSS